MASSAAPERSNLESLLPPAEAALLRLSDESKHLTNELVDLRFKHYVIDDQATALSNRILHLDALIAKDAAFQPGTRMPCPPLGNNLQQAPRDVTGPAQY